MTDEQMERIAKRSRSYRLLLIDSKLEYIVIYILFMNTFKLKLLKFQFSIRKKSEESSFAE